MTQYCTVGKRILVEEVITDKIADIELCGDDIKLYKVIAVGDEVKNIKPEHFLVINKKNVMTFKFQNQKFYMVNEDNILMYFF